MENQSANNKTLPKKPISDALLIAIATLLAYWFTYRYEAGFLDYFHVPREFIDLSLINILNAFCYMASFLLIVYVLVEMAVSYFPKIPSPLRGRFMVTALFFIMAVMVPLMFSRILKGTFLDWAAYPIIFIINIFLVFILPWFKHRKNYAAYLEEIEKRNVRSREETTLLGIAMDIWGPWIFLIFVLIWQGTDFSYKAGESRAMKQVSYYVLGGKEKLAVLKIVDEKLICVGFDEKTKIVDDQLVMLKIENGTALKKEDVGPLSFKEANK